MILGYNLCKKSFHLNKNRCLTFKEVIYRCTGTYFIPLIILFDQNLFLVRSKSCSGQKAVAKHSGNFVCLTCGKNLKRQRSLELHMRQHTGEKSYRVSPTISRVPVPYMVPPVYILSSPHHFIADPDPNFNFDADPDPNFHLMRIREKLGTKTFIR